MVLKKHHVLFDEKIKSKKKRKEKEKEKNIFVYLINLFAMYHVMRAKN